MKTNEKARVVTGDAEIEVAVANARVYDEHRPKAVSVAYRSNDDTIVVKLATGVELSIPHRLLQGLQNVAEDDLSNAEVDDLGSSLYWPSLDVSHYVPGLLEGIFGSRNWMSEIGKLGGASRTVKKQVASRENGRKGGRPKELTLEI